jgi:hypothetical protein
MRAILALSLGVLLGTAVSSARSQTPPPLPPLPSGFQADPGIAQLQAQMRAAGMGDGTSGKKPNENMSPCFSDPKVSFGYGWMLNPAAKTMIDMLLKAPQDPARQGPAYLDEPAGKQAWKGGVLGRVNTNCDFRDNVNRWRSPKRSFAALIQSCPVNGAT